MFVFDAVTINQLRSAALPDSEFFRRPTVGRELFIKDWPEGTLWDVDQNSNADAQDDDERAEFRERPRGTGFTIAGDATQMPGANFKECD